MKEHIDTRFDRLEEKLDQYAMQTVKNSNDIKWMKGAMKTSLSFLLALISGAAVHFFGGV